MGESTFVENNRIPASSAVKTHKRLPVDIPLLAATLVLAVFGIIMVYSSSWRYSVIEEGNTWAVAVRQLQWLGVGIGACIFTYFFNYHYYRRLLIPMVLVTLLLLLSVLVLGEYRFGAKRSVLSSGSVQPSELAKLVIIIYLSYWLYNRREILNNVMLGLIPLGIIIGLFGGLTMAQPDISAALTIVLLGLSLFFLADASTRQIVLLAVICVIVAILAIQFTDTGQSRINSYIQGLQDPANASDHVKQSLQSIARGGVFGVGIGKGSTKVVNLPVAWTDSIFAVIAEETGLLGSLMVILLYMVILWRGIKIANEAPDQLGKLLAGGITFWITWEAILNMGVLVNLFPFAGNALPLVSAGGSSLITILTAIGILANISRSKYVIPDSLEGRSFGAVVDLRRRDWRGRESRPRRPAGRR